MAKQSRLEFHDVLVNILGSSNVYFQPPENLKLNYPCIVYSINNIDTKYTNNYPYKIDVCYQVTLISRDPDDETRDKLLKLQMCRYERQFKSNDLNHDVFRIYI